MFIYEGEKGYGHLGLAMIAPQEQTCDSDPCQPPVGPKQKQVKDWTKTAEGITRLSMS